ncbi:type VI secretion system tip protein VgrG, partial [Escherichia coli]|nr:type VI secretion system tip protein VgrG [Escherichia coli]
MSTGLRFTLEVDGLPPDAFAVVSFHLTQSLSSLFSLDLSLVSQQFLSLEFAQVLDKMAYLTVWQGDDVQRRVKGVVTWFELGENDKNQMLYSMKVCPPLWRTGLRQNFRIFQNEDIESILATILKENGVTEWSPLFSEPHPSREFCVQYGETDYDFLCRMAAEEGIFFYEEHAQKSTDQSLVLCDTVRYLPESFEIPWNPNTRTEVSTFCISQFRYSAQIRPSSVVTKDYTFKRPGWAGRFDQEGQHQDYPDGLESRREYDEPGRLVSETSRSGETVRYRYDDAHSELPATTTDATGSTRQMTWSRYGQLLAFTDCSGYQTRYEYDRFGQMTAVHREEGISLYRRYDNRGRLTSVKDAQGRET